MRVLVCGGRDYGCKDTVFRKLGEWAPEVVIHGACPTGADAFAQEWADTNGVTCRRFPAHWRADGRAAGPIRNSLMLEVGKPDLLLAFPGGRGTADMVKKARAAGVRVIEVK